VINKKMESIKKLSFRIFLNTIKFFSGKRFSKLLRPLEGIANKFLQISAPGNKYEIIVNGYKMLLPIKRNNKIDGFSCEIIKSRVWEPYTTNLFKQLATKGMNCIDIGAHVGYFTLLMAGLAGNSGRVLAFEPAAENYNLLVANIKLNNFKNVSAIQKAVSDRTGQAKLYLNELNSGENTLYGHGNDYTESIAVHTVSIDEFLHGETYPVDIIKIDVEGGELAVLSGMTKTCRLSDNLKLLIEFNPPLLQQSNTDMAEYWDKLIELGFKHIYLIDESRGKLEVANIQEVADIQTAIDYCKQKDVYVNLLCLKNIKY